MATVAVPGVAAGAAGPNLLTNPSFEAPDIATGTFAIFPSIPGWSFAPRNASVTSSGIEIQDHVAGNPDVRPPGAIPAGDQFVEMDSDGPSIVYQDVATTPGNTYRLEWLSSPRPNTLPEENIYRAVGGPDNTHVIGPIASGPQTIWTKYQFTFVATDTTSRIRFEDLSPEQPVGGLGAYIDRVSVREQS
jgi:hypothetical protein